jgi:hypothetical protein
VSPPDPTRLIEATTLRSERIPGTSSPEPGHATCPL